MRVKLQLEMLAQTLDPSLLTPQVLDERVHNRIIIFRSREVTHHNCIDAEPVSLTLDTTPYILDLEIVLQSDHAIGHIAVRRSGSVLNPGSCAGFIRIPH